MTTTDCSNSDVKSANSYRPQGAALELFRCTDTEVLLEGPSGTGKSRACLEKANLLAWRYPGCRILLVRKTRRSMTESTLVTFEEKVVPLQQTLLNGPHRSTRQTYEYPNGSAIVLGGMDRPGKIMSTEFDVVMAFEACELTEEDWEMLLTRLRNAKMPFQQLVADTNPGSPAHWLNQRANDGRMTRLRSRHEDNPTVTAAYLSRLDRLRGMRYRRLRQGQWAAPQGMVYEDWSPQTHLIDPFPIPQSWRRIRAIDFGYTNPFVCQWWALDEDERMYLYREIYHTRQLVMDLAEQINELSRRETIEATVTDHNAEDRATLERFGIATTSATKRIAPGIQAVTARLRVQNDGKPRIFLMRDCLQMRDSALATRQLPICTQQEFESYCWAKNSADERPINAHDHGLDAMRYAVAHVDQLGAAPLTVHVIGEPHADSPGALRWAG